MTYRIAFALAASAAFGLMIYMLEGNIEYMTGGLVAFAISAMYMPDRED